MAIMASSLIEDVVRYLSDFDEDESYVHWSRDDLLSYFRKAIYIVSITKKNKFIKSSELQLVPGIYQKIPDTCESDITINGLIKQDGSIDYRARKSILYDTPRLGRPICRVKSVNDEYNLVSYDFSPSGREIMVEPPVPEGVNAKLSITCFIPPQITGFDSVVDISYEMEPAIFELMLYYAWGVDIEDTANRERSESHWSKAIKLLQLSTGAEELARQVR